MNHLSMSYEVYKILHVLSLVFLAGFIGAAFLGQKNSKMTKIASGVSSLLLLTGGMGLLARLYPGAEWPMWAKAKIAIWLVVAALVPVLSKRLVENRGKAFAFILFLLSVAVCLAILKPF